MSALRATPAVTLATMHSVDPADDHDDSETLNEPLAQHDPALRQHRLHDLDPAADDAAGASGTDVDAGAKRTAVWLGCAVLMAAVAIVFAFAVLGAGAAPGGPTCAPCLERGGHRGTHHR